MQLLLLGHTKRILVMTTNRGQYLMDHLSERTESQGIIEEKRYAKG